MTISAPAEPTQRQVRLATPFTDQKPGTSGLRKSSRQFEEPQGLRRAGDEKGKAQPRSLAEPLVATFIEQTSARFRGW